MHATLQCVNDSLRGTSQWPPRRSPTVGCGVFAVRAKIPPPVATMRRRALCSGAACRVAVKNLPHRDTKRAASFTWFLHRPLCGDAARRFLLRAAIHWAHGKSLGGNFRLLTVGTQKIY